MKRFLLVLIAILVCLIAVTDSSQAKQSKTPTASVANVWCVGTIEFHPYTGAVRPSNNCYDIVIEAAQDSLLAKNPSDYYGRYLVGAFFGENPCSNAIAGDVFPGTVIKITNRSVIRSEMSLLNGHLVYATGRIMTIGEGEGSICRIVNLTITVLR
jgi:uncharacterized membrane protein